MPKVLIADNLSPRAVAIFKERGLECDVKTGLKPEELKAIIEDSDLDGPLVNWREKGHRVEYLGTEDVDGTPTGAWCHAAMYGVGVS